MVDWMGTVLVDDGSMVMLTFIMRFILFRQQFARLYLQIVLCEAIGLPIPWGEFLGTAVVLESEMQMFGGHCQR
jgi:hypothetical protein